MPREIFISYAKGDQDIADELCESLESGGLTCWIAPRNIEPSSNWGASIIDGIAECRIMMLVFSAHSNSSEHVQREILHAVELRRPVFPVRIEETCPTGGLAYCLVGVQWFDAATPPLGRHLPALVARIKGLLEPGGELRPMLGSSADAAKPAPSVPEKPRDIRFDCDHCGQSIVTDESAAGRRAKCPTCGSAFTVPSPRLRPDTETIDKIEASELEEPHEIHFECGQCGQSIFADATAAGRSAKCPTCGIAITVPRTKAHPSIQASLGAGDAADSPAVHLSIAPGIVGKLADCITGIVGPIGPIVVAKAISKTASLDALYAELLALIPDARDQKIFLQCWVGLFSDGGAPVSSAPKPSPTMAEAATKSPVASSLDPATVAELKTTFAAFVGPLAKVLVDRAIAKSANASELLALLAKELDSPNDRERFMAEVPAAMRHMG